jgi:phage RecT family recombinase
MTKKIQKYSDPHQWLASVRKDVIKYASRDYVQDDFLRSAMIAISESWQLQKCMETEPGQASMYNALKLAAITGLSLNPLEGEAALVARKNQNGDFVASYQKMKNGLIKIALEDTDVARIKSDIVRENDVFSIVSTSQGDDYEFKPARKARGEIDGFLAAVTLEDGSVFTKYMTMDEILEHREKYSPYYKDAKTGKEKPDAAWVKSLPGMGIKTVVKAVLNGLNLSSVTRKALIADDQILNAEPVVISGADQVLEKMEEPAAPKEDERDEKPGDIV